MAGEVRMSRPDEGLIHTWLDGECTPDEAARIERLVASDPEWAAAVAEARGLIAASSRIVQALDAVPKAMPSGSRAAPAPVRSMAFRARPWMRVAAGLVLVVGTTYLLRDEPTPFEPTAQLDVATPAPRPAATSDSAVSGAGSVTSLQPPTDLPAGELRTLERVIPAPTAGSPAPFAVAPPSMAPPPPAPAPAALAGSREDAKVTTRQEEERRAVARARLTAEPSRAAAAAAPTADATAGAVAEKALPTLAGCWRVSAPPELVGLLREPAIIRQSGDTLVLRTARGDVTVTRSSDRLRGGLDATLESCPTVR
jgi:hypothetical protein